MLQVGWAAQPLWKETTCMARQSEEDDTLKLEVKNLKKTKRKIDKETDRQRQRQSNAKREKEKDRQRQRQSFVCANCAAQCCIAKM